MKVINNHVIPFIAVFNDSKVNVTYGHGNNSALRNAHNTAVIVYGTLRNIAAFTFWDIWHRFTRSDPQAFEGNAEQAAIFF